LAMLLDEPTKATIDAVIVPMGAAAEARALGLLADLRRGGVAVDMAYKGKMKQRLAKADALGARYALILGDDELEAGVVAVKDLATGDQRKVAFADVAEALR
jgi:histidyl-tRNA synthetase